MQTPPAPPPEPSARPKGGMPAWAIVLIVVAVVGVLAVPATGVMAALAIYGVRRYVMNAKTEEARVGLAQFARGIDQCVAARGTLPETSPSVPADLARVAGQKYLSSPSDWADDAFACAHFTRMDPQYFQYQWVKESATTGYVRAAADLDGDGTPSDFRLRVECTTDSCSVAPRIEERDPTE